MFKCNIVKVTYRKELYLLCRAQIQAKIIIQNGLRLEWSDLLLLCFPDPQSAETVTYCQGRTEISEVNRKRLRTRTRSALFTCGAKLFSRFVYVSTRTFTVKLINIMTLRALFIYFYFHTNTLLPLNVWIYIFMSQSVDAKLACYVTRAEVSESPQ